MKDFGLKKLYYSISEVSKITDLEQYILRYWESEFEQLKPSKNRAGNRIYTNKDIKLILQIKQLLREEKYTIEGAKRILTDGLSDETLRETVEDVEKAALFEEKRKENKDIPAIKEDLEELKKLLQYIQKII